MNLYELSEIADKRFSHGEEIPENIINGVKEIVSNNGYIGMAQINPIAGNIEYNAKKIAKYIKYACKIGLDLVVFPELALMGYPIEDTIDRHPIIVEENKHQATTKSSKSGDEILWIGIGIAVLVITFYYTKYRHQVQCGLIAASIVTEIVTCLVYYYSKKVKVFYGKNIKGILYFNIISILGVPLLIWFINSPWYTSKIKFDLFMQMADNNGILSAFLHSEYGYYALFQMAGMFFIAMFLVHIISSDIYIIAVTNITAGSSGMWIWNGLFRLTYKRGKSWKQHFKVGILFLIFSILFAAGIFPYVIIKLSNGNFGV